jgi:hypothetical protein
MQHQEIEPHAGGWPAVHGIEDMGGQASRTRHWVIPVLFGATIDPSPAQSKGWLPIFLPFGPHLTNPPHLRAAFALLTSIDSLSPVQR